MRIALLQQKTPQRSADGTIQVLSEIIRQHSPDVLIGAEFLFVAPIQEGWDGDRKEPTYTPRIFDETEKGSLDKKLQGLTQGNGTLLLPGTVVWAEGNHYRNSCPLFQKGQKIIDIKKEFPNGSDQLHAPAKIARKAYNTFMFTSPLSHEAYLKQHSFILDSKRYLLDICDDHVSQARRLGAGDLPPQIVDVQIIVSNSIHHHFATPRSALFVRDGGLVIECNGYYPTAFMGRVSGNKIETIYQSEQLATDLVQMIKMTL